MALRIYKEGEVRFSHILMEMGPNVTEYYYEFLPPTPSTTRGTQYILHYNELDCVRRIAKGIEIRSENSV